MQLVLFFVDPIITNMISQATTQATAIACNNGLQTYAVGITLKSGSGYYCVDSNGTSSSKTTAKKQEVYLALTLLLL